MSTLYDIYVDKSLEEYTSLEDFVAQVDSGAFGMFTEAERTAFLRQVEANMLASVESQIAARPHLAGHREEIIGETRVRIQMLIDQVMDQEE